MNALPSLTAFARLCPRVLRQSRKSIVCQQPTRSFITSIHNRIPRCPRTFQPIKPTLSQKRHASFPVAAKKLFKQYPFSVSLATIMIICGAGVLVYTNYIYSTFILGAFHAYPEPVAVKLRRAIHYTNVDPQPKNALKYYQQALSVAEELGMDPFSDEILGVKIQVAFMMEKIQKYDKAIEVLEIVRGDCLKWMEKIGGTPGKEGQRTRVLQKTIGMSVKLGELYSSDYIQDPAAAEEKLVWAVTNVLQERLRRENEGVKEGEGDWMSNDEIGAAVEALATHYESHDHHYLATHLYLHAIALSPPQRCHTVTLMSNLSACLAQQLPPPTPSTPPASRSELLQNARLWAEKAIKLSKEIKVPARDTECDVGCAASMINLGGFYQMEGLAGEARGWFEEGKEVSRAVGYTMGVEEAEDGLRRLDEV